MQRSSGLFIRNGKVVTEDAISVQDILIRGERIADMGDLKETPVENVIDASGLLVLPGAIDPHVHFNDEFMGTVSVHDYFTGTRAAAYGGVTSIIDFSNQASGQTLGRTLDVKASEAEGQALIDWGVHPVITQPTSQTLDEIEIVAARGAPTIKCYMTYRSEGLMMTKPELKLILERLHKVNGMLMLHAEDNDMIEESVARLIKEGKTSSIFHAHSRPPVVEEHAIRQAVEIAGETGGRVFIVHMATDKGVGMIGDAQSQGVDIRAETCTHYLIFTDKMLEREDGIKWICSPPLRSLAVQEALWGGIQKRIICQVSSDDAAFSWEAKLAGKDRFDRCPNGIPGIEPRLNLLYSEGVRKGRLSLSQMVELTATAPAKQFGLYPWKGVLAPGSHADIVLFDPEEKWMMGHKSLHMATDWSAYEGMEMTGKIKKVFSRGELIIDGEKCLAEKGRGRYLHREL